jgi:mRNA interferase MazF
LYGAIAKGSGSVVETGVSGRSRLAGVTRGDVYRVRLPRGRGREQQAPATRWWCRRTTFSASTTLVAPTSRSALAASFGPEVQVGGESTRVMVEQLRALDVQRLGNCAGRLEAEEMRDVDEALSLMLALR